MRCTLLLLLLLTVAMSTSRAKPVQLAFNASVVEANCTGSTASGKVTPATAPRLRQRSWQWQVAWRTPPIGHRFTAEPLVMDLNADGADEIVLAGFDGAFSVIGAGDGSADGLGAWPRFHHGEAHFAAPIRFDVDRDGEEELIFTSYSGALHFYSQLGELKHEDRLPSIRVPTRWLSTGPAAALSSSSSQLLDATSSSSSLESPSASLPIVIVPSNADTVSNTDPQSEQLNPSVFASPLLCDCNADALRNEFVLGVSFVGERRVVSALLLYSLSRRQPLVWHWLEHTFLSAAKPAYLLSTPFWARLLPEHSFNSLVTASASGRLFAHRYDSKDARFVSLSGFPVQLGSLLHPPLLLSSLHPEGDQSASSSTSETSSLAGVRNLVVVHDSTSDVVSGFDARGRLVWSTTVTTRTTKTVNKDGSSRRSLLSKMTPLTEFYRAGQAYAAAFVPAADAVNVDSDDAIIGQLLLISASDGQLRSVDVRLVGGHLSASQPHLQHSLVDPMSRLTPLTCQFKPGKVDGTNQEIATVFVGIDWLGQLTTIELSEDAAEAFASRYMGFNATSALGVSGVNSERTGLADLVVLTTEGRAIKLGSRLIDNLTGANCDLRIQESLSIRIQGAPYIEQSGSTLILPIVIEDLLNPDGLMSVVYTVHVYIYNKATLSMRYPRPGPHLMYFDAGSRPLKSQLLLRLTTSADARVALSQATLVANVNYVYEMPFLLYLPVAITLLLLLGQAFTVEDSLELPFVARHAE